MRIGATRNWGQHGNSVVEFAIVAPVMVMLVLFATYFHDAVQTKLTTQEAAHFGAWEFTSFPLSDYSATHDSQRLFTDARTRIAADLTQKYSHFDSALPNKLKTTFVADHTLITTDLNNDTGVPNLPTPLVSGRTLGSIPGLGGLGSLVGNVVSGGLDIVGPKPFGFNMNGTVSFKVTTQFTNRILPQGFEDSVYSTPMVSAMLGQFSMDDTVALVADAWTLHDGRDVDLHSGTDASPGQGLAVIESQDNWAHPMGTEVQRMVFAGIEDRIIPAPARRLLAELDSVAGAFGFPDPLFANGPPVTAINYARSSSAPGWADYGCSEPANPAISGMMELRNSNRGRDIDLGQHCFQTIPFRVTNAYASSPMVQIFNDSNKYYMGCKLPQAEVGTSACH